jgi:hypothetical protein
MAKKNIKNQLYQYTTPRERVIYDSDGTTGDRVSRGQEQC